MITSTWSLLAADAASAASMGDEPNALMLIPDSTMGMAARGTFLIKSLLFIVIFL
jgi:hypothetical protein